MQIQKLPSIKKRSQRIGRSGKRGSYSGRGVKGQKSRSGRRLRPAERDLIIRLPKHRGFRNKPKADKPLVFNVSDLSAKLKSHATGKAAVEISVEAMKAAGLLRKGFTGVVKILGKGTPAFPMAIAKGIRVSGSAKAKIVKTGGNVAP